MEKRAAAERRPAHTCSHGAFGQAALDFLSSSIVSVIVVPIGHLLRTRSACIDATAAAAGGGQQLRTQQKISVAFRRTDVQFIRII